MGLCTRSHKVKEGNRVTLSCLRCFLWGKHSALEAIQARLRPSERLMAFFDDIYGKSDRDLSSSVHGNPRRASQSWDPCARWQDPIVEQIWCGPHRSPSIDRKQRRGWTLKQSFGVEMFPFLHRSRVMVDSLNS